MREKPNWWQGYVTIVCLVSGMLLAWQLQAHAAYRASTSQGKEPNLVQVIEALEEEITGQEEDLARFRNEVAMLQKSEGEGVIFTSARQQELDRLRQLAGLTEVTGPGIIITLDDNQPGAMAAKNSSLASFNPENFIIHYTDVLYLVYELRAAGARAISINNQRVTTGSEIRCVGTVILVNTSRLAPPYEIKALGNPEALEKAILQGQQFPLLKGKEFPVKTVREGFIRILPYKGSFSTDYVKEASLPPAGPIPGTMATSD